MKKRASHQPAQWHTDEEATRVLPTGSHTSESAPATSPTRVIKTPGEPAGFQATGDSPTEVLPGQFVAPASPATPRTEPYPQPADTEQTRVIASQASYRPTLSAPSPASSSSSAAGARQKFLPSAYTGYGASSAHPATSIPPAESSTPSGRLDGLRPSNIRQTRPTTWAMIQHFLTLITFIMLFVATIVFFVQTQVGQELDETSFTEFSYQFMNYQSQTRNLLDLIPATAGLLAAIGLVFVLIWKHRFLPAIVGLLIAVGANLSAQVLKNYLIDKPDYGIHEAVMNSSPSGHTTFAAAAASALFLASPKKLRPGVALIGMVFTLAAGFSTVINGWHRPSDVVAAIFLSGAWTVIGLAILRFMRSEELDMSNTERSGLILVPLLTIAAFFMSFCALALFALTFYDPIPGGALTAATCMILSAACFSTSVLVSLLRPQNKHRKVYTKVWTY